MSKFLVTIANVATAVVKTKSQVTKHFSTSYFVIMLGVRAVGPGTGAINPIAEFEEAKQAELEKEKEGKVGVS